MEGKSQESANSSQEQINFHGQSSQSTKVKLLVLNLRHFCNLHGSEVTLF